MIAEAYERGAAGAAYFSYAAAVRHATAIEVMLIPVIEPILSPLWVALAFGERPSAWALAGGTIVVGAVTVRPPRPTLTIRTSRPRVTAQPSRPTERPLTTQI